LSAAQLEGVQRIRQAFAANGKRAALMPYLMGGFPTLDESARIGEACVTNGADVIELGMPYSDPLADGPVIHAAGTQALAAGANVAGVLEVARALSASVPVVLMCYANMVFAPGVESFLDRLARSGACGLIVPDLPHHEASEVLAAHDHAAAAG
jgi:tryptophan synthase alpha chain